MGQISFPWLQTAFCDIIVSLQSGSGANFTKSIDCQPGEAGGPFRDIDLLVNWCIVNSRETSTRLALITRLFRVIMVICH